MANSTQPVQANVGADALTQAMAKLAASQAAGEPLAPALTEIARLYVRLRDDASAVTWFERVVQAGPAPSQIHEELALALVRGGHLARAAEVVTARLAKKPKEFALVNLLGVIYRRQGRLREALAQLATARKLEPTKLAPWVNAGNVYYDLAEGGKAEEMFAKASRMAQKDAETVRLLGRSQQMQGKLAEAATTLKRCLAMDPKLIKAVHDLSMVLSQLGKPLEALELIDRKLEMMPGSSELLIAKAVVTRKLGRMDEAIALYQQALAADPKNADGWINLGRLYAAGDREKANACFFKATQADPKSLSALTWLCDSLNRSRYGDEAMHIGNAWQVACTLMERFDVAKLTTHEEVRAVLKRCLDFERLERMGHGRAHYDFWARKGAGHAFLLELSRAETYDDRLNLVAAHRQWGRLVETRRPESALTRSPRGPREKIRVGLMSNDLRSHPVSYFAMPLLEHYDKSRFELFCYSTYGGAEDNAQRFMRGLVDAYRWTPEQTELGLAQSMADDRLDILFELGGTTNDRFEAMAYRPAPVQVSWLGYAHSSGLGTIDYLLVDPYLKPEDPRLLIEKPFELPQTWVTLGRLGFHDQAITPGIPETRKGYLTFGTMNNPYKYTPDCFAAWAAIMQQVPGSRFLFVRPEGKVEAFRKHAEAAFAAHGVTADRVMFTAVRGTHMQHYNDIDIALDTFPHVGGTTTCETLWMGVPTVTLVGPAFFERISYSNLSNAGLGDLCAFTVADYVAKAVGLAGDRARREYLRHNLRQDMAKTPLGQVDAFVEAFYGKIEDVLT